jgi:hypothetical protein
MALARKPHTKTPRLTPSADSHAFNEKAANAILGLIQAGNFYDTAAKASGITEQTLRAWIAAGEKGQAPYTAFVKRLEVADAQAEVVLVSLLNNAATGNAKEGADWKAKAWMAERRLGDRWGSFRKKFERKLVELADSTPVAEHTLESIPAYGCSKSERIGHIARLMAANRWYCYASRAELSRYWGVEDQTIRVDAAEAQRRFELDEDEIKQQRRQHALSCEAMKREAMTTRNLTTGMLDVGAALKAIDAVAKYQGADVPIKASVELSAGPTPADAAKAIRLFFGERVATPPPDEEEATPE